MKDFPRQETSFFHLEIWRGAILCPLKKWKEENEEKKGTFYEKHITDLLMFMFY